MSFSPPARRRDELDLSSSSDTVESDLPSYDVVVATRNRFDALVLSVPLILGQSPAPSKLIVVDSSDEASRVDEVVASLSQGNGTEIDVIRSPPGLPLQRNRGLEHVTAPIVFFPDDDALWHPDFARHVLEVYARDEEGLVGGVGGVEVFEMPGTAEPTYTTTRSAHWNQRIAPWRHRFERRFFPEPLTLAGRDLMRRHELPSWVDGEKIVAVEHVTGFRMSFRSSFVSAARFDENLGGYALSEDADMSLTTWRDHLLLASHSARVKHHKRPGGREVAWRDGYFHILNYIYVVAKHTPLGSAARRRMVPWALYRCAMYAARARDASTRDRLRGALASVPVVRRLAAAPSERDVVEIYLRAIAMDG